MTSRIPFPRRFLLAGLVFVTTGLPAQDQKTTPEAQREKAAFDRVAQHLDTGGNFLAYLDTAALVRRVKQHLQQMESREVPAVRLQIAEDNAAAAETLETGVRLLNRFADGGLADLDGAGASSRQYAPGRYRNKLFLHHAANKTRGWLWSVFHTPPHPLTWVELLPETTAVAVFADVDLPMLMVWPHDLVQASQNKELIATTQAWGETLGRRFQFAELLAGYAGELGWILTLDPENKVTLGEKVGEVFCGNVQFPEPALALVVKVRNNSIENVLATKIFRSGDTAWPCRELTVGRYKLRSYSAPLHLPFAVAPTFVTVDGYLILGSNPKIVEQMLAAKAGTRALKRLPEYVQATEGLPSTGNFFHYVSPRLGPALVATQAAAAAVLAAPEIAPLVRELLSMPGRDDFACGVGQVLDEGLLFQANSSLSGVPGVAVNAAAVPGVFGWLAVPGLLVALERGPRVSCADNLKQLSLACLLYSGEYSGAFPPDLGALVEKQILRPGRIWVCPRAAAPQVPASAAEIRAGKCGYVYVGAGLRDDDSKATVRVLAYDRPGNHGGRWLYALFVDGHVEGVPAGSIEEACQKKGWLLPKARAP